MNSAVQDIEAAQARTLLAAGVLTEDQLQQAEQVQAEYRKQAIVMPLVEVLLRHKLATPEQLREHLLCALCGAAVNGAAWSPGHAPLCMPCIKAETKGGKPSEKEPGTPEELDRAGIPFGRYRLLRELGRGGMGIVWKAWDTLLKRPVALKQVLSHTLGDREAIERFMREARAAARLHHPNIVQVHDVGVHDGKHFFTADYVDGESLDRMMTRSLPLRRAVEIVRDAARALAYAHEQGILHRDIKPGNLLVDSQGRGYVTDFGLARDVEGAARAGLTLTGVIMGTPQYMSPEQAEGKNEQLGPASDQFSLGVVLYELLTGRRPFEGKGLRDLLNSILSQDPVPPSRLVRRIPRDVETICLKALEKDPARRYPTLGDLADDLQRYLDGEPISARPLSPLESAWRKAKRHREVVVPAVLAGAGLVVFVTLLIRHSLETAEKISQWMSEAAEKEKAGVEKYEKEGAQRYEKGGAEDLLNRAKDLYLQVLSQDPDHLAAKEGRDRVDRVLRKIEELRLEWIRITLEETKAQEEALKLIEAGRTHLDMALRYLYRPEAKYPDLVARVGKGQPQIEAAVDRAKRMALGHWLLGRCHELRGDPGSAVECWKRAISLEPDHARSHYHMARWHLYHALLTRLATADAARGRMEAERRMEEAGKEIEAVRKPQTPVDDPVEREVARALLAYARRDPRAMAMVRKGLARPKMDGVEDLYLIGYALAESPAEAAEMIEGALRIRRKFPIALGLRAVREFDEGDGEGALRDLEEAIEFAPKLPELLSLRARVHFDAGRFALAHDDWKRLLEIVPVDWPFRAEAEQRLAVTLRRMPQ